MSEAFSYVFGPQKTILQVTVRLFLFVLCSAITIAVAHRVSSPVTVGATFGYAWGSLSTAGLFLGDKKP